MLANAVRDYVRDHASQSPGAERRERCVRLAGSGEVKEPGERPPITGEQTARELLDHAAHCLPEEQFRAVSLWVVGAEFDEIARDLGLSDAGAAQRQVRAGLAVLRRRFAGAA